ncbi:MAG: spermidine/putrescine ABC transporter permease PotC, partial [Mesorhizobium sp.]
MSAPPGARAARMASRFDIRRQTGFTTIAMICFFALY